MQLHDYLEYFSVEAPEHNLAELGDHCLSYSQANQRANQMARAIVSLGVERGEHFAFLCKNSIDMALMYFAASKAGVVPVPMNYRLAPTEWQYIINDAECKALICEQEFVDGIQSIRPLLSARTFVAMGASGDGWLEWDSLLAGQATDNLNLDSDPGDQLYQMYTSGTTGFPKGVIISRAAVDDNIHMLNAQLRMPIHDTRMLMVMPAYHTSAATSVMSCVSNCGTIIIHREFDPHKVIHDLIEKKITHGTLVPAMIQRCLLEVPGIAEKTFPHLSNMAYGASPIAESVLRAAMAVFKCDFIQGFGMTEAACGIALLSAETHRRALRGEPHLLLSCGRAVMGTQLRIVDEHGEPVATGVVGEIVIKGPQVMDGYWGNPEATRKALRDGWLFTGDAAYVDAEGFVYIQDRIKDMIVSGGENIYPKEVENALFEHPAIADAAVIGIPSERWGETVLAVIVTNSGTTFDEAQVTEFCRQRIAGYKLPRQYKLVDAIPRNASGKPLKAELRKPFWDGVNRKVS